MTQSLERYSTVYRLLIRELSFSESHGVRQTWIQILLQSFISFNNILKFFEYQIPYLKNRDINAWDHKDLTRSTCKILRVEHTVHISEFMPALFPLHGKIMIKHYSQHPTFLEFEILKIQEHIILAPFVPTLFLLNGLSLVDSLCIIFLWQSHFPFLPINYICWSDPYNSWQQKWVGISPLCSVVFSSLLGQWTISWWLVQR